MTNDPNRPGPQGPVTLETARLALLPCGLEPLQVLCTSPAEFENLFQVGLAEGYVEGEGALEYAVERMLENPPQAGWWAPLLLVHREDRQVIGLGGFRGPPVDGAVEIGFGVAPAYRGRGLAGEACQAMVDWALADPHIQVVRAHTLAEKGATTAILTRCGLRKVAELLDGEDGLIWRWEREKLERGE
jgi:RimJ/RimL family protein N-acetyltransferase